jgi:hypothetical protein
MKVFNKPDILLSRNWDHTAMPHRRRKAIFIPITVKRITGCLKPRPFMLSAIDNPYETQDIAHNTNTRHFHQEMGSTWELP